MASRKFYSSNINLIVQQYHINKLFPNSITLSVKKELLKWVGVIQPSQISSKYKILLTYKLFSSPKVYVISPKLDFLLDKKPPHVYSPDNRLCLYIPGEWNGSFLIAETIIPWISEWLLHYEIWLVTGEWMGGGKHP